MQSPEELRRNTLEVTLPAVIANLLGSDAVADVRDKLAGLGLEPMWLGPEEFASRVRAESAKVALLVKELGIKMD